jgi:hypothetical protein
MPRKRPAPTSAGMVSGQPLRAEHVTRVGSRGPWTDQRVHEHLMLAPPFVQCQPQHIRADTEFRELQEFPCRNWSALVVALGDILVDYMAQLYTLHHLPQEMARQTEAALGHLPAVARLLFALRDRKLLSPGAKRNVHKYSLFRKLQAVTEVFLSLTPDDYVAGEHLLTQTLDYQQCCVNLYTAFDDYGPTISPASRTAFSYECLYHACAAILIHFDLERADQNIVAASFGHRVRNYLLRRT